MLEGKRACLKAVAESGIAEPSHIELEVNFMTNGSDNAGNNNIAPSEASENSPLLNPEDTITSALTPGDSVEDSVQQEQTDISHIPSISQQLTKVEREKQARHERRQERYEEVQQLHQQGLSIRKISRRLKLSRITVRKYIKAETCPMYPEGVTRGSKLAFYIDYIQQRWDTGCHNASQIWRELRQLGFDGSQGLVARWAAKERVKLPSTDTQDIQSSVSSCTSDSSSHRSSQGTKAAPKSEVKNEVKNEVVPWSPSRAAWLLIKPVEDLTLEDEQALERMRQADKEVAEAYSLGQRFINMIRERQPDALLP